MCLYITLILFALGMIFSMKSMMDVINFLGGISHIKY